MSIPLIIAATVISCLLTALAVLTVASVGMPRKPVTPAQTVLDVAFYITIVAVIWFLAAN